MVKDAAIHENTEQTDLVKVLRRCLEAAQVAELPFTLDAPENLIIDCRPLSIERLFTNLVDNALHYGRSVDIRAYRDDMQTAVIVEVMGNRRKQSFPVRNKLLYPLTHQVECIYGRLHVLRNQIIHGGSTWAGAINRAQVRDGAEILGSLIPVFVDLMMDNPLHPWKEPIFPVVS